MGGGPAPWPWPRWNSQTKNASSRPTVRASWIQMLQPVRKLWVCFNELELSTTKTDSHKLILITGLPLHLVDLRKFPEESHLNYLKWTWTPPDTQSSRMRGWRDPPSTGQPKDGYLRAPIWFYPLLPWSPSQCQSLMTCRWFYAKWCQLGAACDKKTAN